MLTENKNLVNGYYNPKTLEKFSAAYRKAVKAVKAGDIKMATISNSNSKMGAVASVSLLPFMTCPERCAETCGGKCYAAKLANLRPAVLNSYARNTALVMYQPRVFWESVELAVKSVRFFRFHVSGDIINREYFHHMVDIAERNQETEILCFTKRYEVVNWWIQEGHEIPANLHILFSGWNNLAPVNPYHLPETNIFRNESDIRDGWKICGGNCFNCACRGVGCWQASKGDTIAFKLH